MIQKAYKKCAKKKRLAGNCKGVLSGADDTAFDEKITYPSEGKIS